VGLSHENARHVGSDGLRIAILTGTGEKAFCAGGDLKEMVVAGMTLVRSEKDWSEF